MSSPLNSRWKGLQATNEAKPRAFKQRALKTFGSDPKTSLVAGTSLTSKAWSTTSVKPESCSDERREGSWKTYTVTTSVPKRKRDGP